MIIGPSSQAAVSARQAKLVILLKLAMHTCDRSEMVTQTEKQLATNYTLAAKEPKQRHLRESLEACSLGAHNLGQPIWDLGHPPGHLSVLYMNWGHTGWEPTASGRQPWICRITYRCFTETGGLQSGSLQSQATDFGSARANSCASHRLGAYSLGAYIFWPPIWDLPENLPAL